VLGACAVALIVPSVAIAAPTVVVTPKNQMGWSTADTNSGGDVNFVVDPTAPAGKGALQLTTDNTNAAKAQYMHNASVPLSSVSSLSYYTKQNSASSPTGDPSYQLPVLLNANDPASFTTLVFEPYWNPTEGPVVAHTWQSWDAYSGQWWSSKSYTDPNAPGCSVTAGAGGPPFYNLTALNQACSNAAVIGFGVNVGTYNPSYDVETDLFNFNGTVYDFEPSKSACSQNGWEHSNGKCSGLGDGPGQE
jgi:hypothetical protein